MSADLAWVIAATAQWLVRAYPASGGALAGTLAEVQARQAVTVAAWLRYPTSLDTGLLGVLGPGGSDRLDWLVGVEPDPAVEAEPWRTWVDEVLASWAACLLADPALAAEAIAALSVSEHASGLHCDFRRLTGPDERDRRAAPLLRHPDLLAPVADLYRAELHARLGRGTAAAA
ncbi:MAG: hypothetical protein E6F99_24010 [Actinobacteria bacterium]|nr:MAG: hypothetical protein E6F99_24010 [Actinomycetota bacterium]